MSQEKKSMVQYTQAHTTQTSYQDITYLQHNTTTAWWSAQNLKHTHSSIISPQLLWNSTGI